MKSIEMTRHGDDDWKLGIRHRISEATPENSGGRRSKLWIRKMKRNGYKNTE
jgi:hypothetical protein